MSVDNYLEAFGYAPIAIIIKRATTQSREPSENIESKFVSSTPKGIGASLSMKQRDQTYRYFSNLGIYYGFMDKEGVKSVQDIKEFPYEHRELY